MTIFYILSIKHNNKIALRVSWKICCLYLVVISAVDIWWWYLLLISGG